MKSLRTVLVTGASSGIGAALAKRYAAAGTTLLLTGRDLDRLRETSRVCEGLGSRCELLSLDHRDSDPFLARLAGWDRVHRIDLAILNAGVASSRQQPGAELVGDIMAEIETNVTATILAGNLLVEAMLARRRGQIALMSSLNALFPVGDAPTYCATKAAISAYGAALDDWVGDQGVSVAVIHCGFVRTGIADRYRGIRPFEWSAERAASVIEARLKRGCRQIAFPFPLVAAIRLHRLVPRALRSLVLRRYRATLEPLQRHNGFSKTL